MTVEVFSSFLNIFLIVYASLFPIINPLGGAPIFLSFVRHCSPATRKHLARKIALYGFTLLVCAMLFGARILTFFGISLPVLHMAGGLVVASIGWSLLHQGVQSDKHSEAVALNEETALENAFYPLTLPLTVGPGVIATAIAISAGHTPITPDSLMQVAVEAVAALSALVAIALTIYFAYREAGTIERVLGRRGTDVLVRLFAFILLAIGLQMLWSGLQVLLGEVFAAQNI
ncbi:MAG: MarC family protein [Xanthobacter sp.]